MFMEIVMLIFSGVVAFTTVWYTRLTRKLVTKNFDKDFANAVLSELEKETE